MSEESRRAYELEPVNRAAFDRGIAARLSGGDKSANPYVATTQGTRHGLPGWNAWMRGWEEQDKRLRQTATVNSTTPSTTETKVET